MDVQICHAVIWFNVRLACVPVMTVCTELNSPATKPGAFFALESSAIRSISLPIQKDSRQDLIIRTKE